MLIQLSSANPNLSYVIGKNPNSPPKLDTLRQGALFGWYNGSSYYVYFMDAPDEVSFPEYKDQEFEYLSQSRFNCPLILKSVLNSYFGKIYSEHDIESTNTMVVKHLRIRDRTKKLIEKFLDGIQTIAICEGVYEVSISRTSTLQEFINYVEVFALIVALDNREFVEMPETLSTKYFQHVANLDLPYFVRYILKQHLVRDSRKKFEVISDLINSGSNHYQFVPYSNFVARQLFCKPYYNGKVIDIGCGEGRYLSKFGGGCSLYVGVEPDEGRRHKCEWRAKKKQINVELYASVEDVPPDRWDGANIIMTEMVEHIAVGQVDTLMNFLSHKNYRSIVITTPNSEFNQHYGLYDEMRHDEHVWELPSTHFRLVLEMYFHDVEFVPIGDLVNGIAPTGGFIVRNM